tara:strand:+ start:274 stop:477 length:204 start_codon:yes stop_codon:yes gene_type:complete
MTTNMALYEVDIKWWDDLCVETKIVSTNPASINDDTIFYTFKDEDEIEAFMLEDPIGEFRVLSYLEL